MRTDTRRQRAQSGFGNGRRKAVAAGCFDVHETETKKRSARRSVESAAKSLSSKSLDRQTRKSAGWRRRKPQRYTVSEAGTAQMPVRNRP